MTSLYEKHFPGQSLDSISSINFLSLIHRGDICYGDLHAELINTDFDGVNRVLHLLMQEGEFFGLEYALELLTDLPPNGYYLLYFQTFCMNAAFQIGTPEFKRIWDKHKETIYAVWTDMLLGMFRRNGNEMDFPLTTLMDRVEFSWILEDYMLSVLQPKGLLDNLGIRQLRRIATTEGMERVSYVLGCRAPDSEEDKNWLARFHIGGLDLANGEATMINSELSMKGLL